MSNYKRKNHEIATEYQTEINPDIHYVVPVDTSIPAMLARNANRDFTPNYSGDIIDMSYNSLMDVKTMRDQVTNGIQELEETIKNSRVKPEPTKPVQTSQETQTDGTD